MRQVWHLIKESLTPFIYSIVTQPAPPQFGYDVTLAKESLNHVCCLSTLDSIQYPHISFPRSYPDSCSLVFVFCYMASQIYPSRLKTGKLTLGSSCNGYFCLGGSNILDLFNLALTLIIKQESTTGQLAS